MGGVKVWVLVILLVLWLVAIEMHVTRLMDIVGG